MLLNLRKVARLPARAQVLPVAQVRARHDLKVALVAVATVAQAAAAAIVQAVVEAAAAIVQAVAEAEAALAEAAQMVVQVAALVRVTAMFHAEKCALSA